jgi:hypothetical protein
MLTHERLRDLLSYNSLTGEFTWRPRANNGQGFNTRLAGKRAGTVHNGYCSIELDGEPHRASRLAWFYMTGEYPSSMIDHKDGDTLNDRFTNLRPASCSENGANAKRRRDNTSGYKGVSFSKALGKFKAYLRKDGKYVHLGCFDSGEAAHAAYVAASAIAFGEFSRAA